MGEPVMFANVIAIVLVAETRALPTIIPEVCDGLLRIILSDVVKPVTVKVCSLVLFADTLATSMDWLYTESFVMFVP